MRLWQIFKLISFSASIAYTIFPFLARLWRVSRASPGMHFAEAPQILRQVSHDLDMKPQGYALILLALLLWADFLEAARQLRRPPRGGYRRKKVSLLKSVKVYYKDPPCRFRSKLGRKICSRPRKLRRRLKPSRSDTIADYDNAEILQTTTTSTTTTTTEATFSSQDFGPYFSEIAKAFAQSLESGILKNQVQYTDQAKRHHSVWKSLKKSDY